MYEVETLHYGGEWINTWTEDGKILLFQSRAEAQEALDDLLKHMPDDPRNYRIIEEDIPEDGICQTCNGSGEGMHEDTTCPTCKGRGEY
jgi:rubrerythrin